jgi:hypothetical protein
MVRSKEREPIVRHGICRQRFGFCMEADVGVRLRRKRFHRGEPLRHRRRRVAKRLDRQGNGQDDGRNYNNGASHAESDDIMHSHGNDADGDG